MPRFSTYTSDYTNPQVLPWDFWTDQQRSLVIKNAYKQLALTSTQVKSYIGVTKTHMVTQWLGPIALAGLYQFALRPAFFTHFQRKSLWTGRVAAFLFLSSATWTWLNFSPFYIAKETSQQETLNYLYNKIGTAIKILNDNNISRTKTSTSIDKELIDLYNKRNGSLAGTLYAQEDTIPPILQTNQSNKNWKKIYK